MGKKSSQSTPMKASKHEKKVPQLNSNVMKILRPKVYITDTCNFKRLVQELTGNGPYPLPEPSPPPTSLPLSTPSWEAVPFVDEFNYQDLYHQNVAYQDSMTDVSFGSSSLSFTSTSMEASPDLGMPAASMEESEKMEFYKGLESMLMEMEMDCGSGSSDYDIGCYDLMFPQQDQVCLYDYDLSNFV